jgi:hypothetical protein
MRFWLSGPRIGWFRPGVSFGPEDFRRKPRPGAPVVLEPDSVERVYRAYLQLVPEERRRLLRRIARSAELPMKDVPGEPIELTG